MSNVYKLTSRAGTSVPVPVRAGGETNKKVRKDRFTLHVNFAARTGMPEQAAETRSRFLLRTDWDKTTHSKSSFAAVNVKASIGFQAIVLLLISSTTFRRGVLFLMSYRMMLRSPAVEQQTSVSTGLKRTE